MVIHSIFGLWDYGTKYWVGAWQALADDIVILSKEETHAFSHYQALLSKLDLERIVKTRQELAHEGKNPTWFVTVRQIC